MIYTPPAPAAKFRYFGDMNLVHDFITPVVYTEYHLLIGSKCKFITGDLFPVCKLVGGGCLFMYLTRGRLKSSQQFTADLFSRLEDQISGLFYSEFEPRILCKYAVNSVVSAEKMSIIVVGSLQHER